MCWICCAKDTGRIHCWVLNSSSLRQLCWKVRVQNLWSVIYTTSTFFCPKELFAFLVLRHFGIDGCHGTTRFSFAWLRVIEYGHLIVRSEEGCRTIFCLFSLSRMRTLSIASCFSAYMLDRYGIAIFDRLILILDVVPAPSVTANLQDWWGGLASSFPK